MKFLAIFFSVYLLAMCSLPCLCENECAGDQTEQSTSKENHQDDACVPFCSCSCCHTVVNNVQLAIFSSATPTFENSQSFSYPQANFTSSHAHNIWQPPRFYNLYPRS